MPNSPNDLAADLRSLVPSGSQPAVWRFVVQIYTCVHLCVYKFVVFYAYVRVVVGRTV